MLSGCLLGFACPSGKCELPPASGPCATHDYCQPGVAYCDAATMCVPLKANGDACAIDPECAGGYCDVDKCADAITYCHEP
jgi:hypothetical protein